MVRFTGWVAEASSRLSKSPGDTAPTGRDVYLVNEADFIVFRDANAELLRPLEDLLHALFHCVLMATQH